MSSYVDKDSLIKRLKNRNYVGNCIFCDYYETCVNRKGSHKNCWKEITTSDCIEIIRCKDCKYWQDNNGGYPHPECRWGRGETPDKDDYCSYAERKDEQ